MQELDDDVYVYCSVICVIGNQTVVAMMMVGVSFPTPGL
jgi:hypothetical protein